MESHKGFGNSAAASSVNHLVAPEIFLCAALLALWLFFLGWVNTGTNVYVEFVRAVASSFIQRLVQETSIPTALFAGFTVVRLDTIARIFAATIDFLGCLVFECLHEDNSQHECQANKQSLAGVHLAKISLIIRIYRILAKHELDIKKVV